MIKTKKRIRSSSPAPFASQVGVSTYQGIVVTSEALFSSELELIEQEQEGDLREELQEYEALVRAERLYR